MLDEGVSVFQTLGAEWGIQLSKESQERLELYARGLLEWNKSVNLTGARSLEVLACELVPNSFALARLCPPNAKVVDIGSGGGLPAIPFSILRPDCHVTLVEPRAKRTAFLSMAVRSCQCSLVSILRARVQDVEGGGYSLASSKATFPPEVWMEISQPLVCSDGRIVVFASTKPLKVPSGLYLAEGFSYKTKSGVSRWCGAYCFT